MDEDYESWASEKIQKLINENYQLTIKVAELQSSHDALKAQLDYYRGLEPVARIVVTTSPRYKKGTINIRHFCDVDTIFKSHETIVEDIPLYALEKK